MQFSMNMSSPPTEKVGGLFLGSSRSHLNNCRRDRTQDAFEYGQQSSSSPRGDEGSCSERFGKNSTPLRRGDLTKSLILAQDERWRRA